MNLIERLQRRIAYGGKKGRRAACRLRKIDRRYCTDRMACANFYRNFDNLIKKNYHIVDGVLRPRTSEEEFYVVLQRKISI